LAPVTAYNRKSRGHTFVKNILAKAQTAMLERCGASNALLVFDFDGTLAPVGKDTRVAQLRAGTRRALAGVAARYPTAVISGRARADVLARLGGIPLRAVIGNHGLEPSPGAQHYRSLLRTWLPKLRDALEAVPGVSFENKLYSLSIHYREAKNTRSTLKAIHKAVSELGDEATSMAGDGVIDVLPAGAPHRGSAVASLCETFGVDSAIYVGRDAADEQAFESKGPALIAIRVGRTRGGKAGYYLSTQSDVDRLLKSLILARPAPERLRT
jgi:trehalose 6-phosphate phosphatase